MRYYKSLTRNEKQFSNSFLARDINEKIIPLLNKYPLISVKKEYYIDFVELAELINYKYHLTKKGIGKIKIN